jgi:hypothetical protein
MSEEKTTVANTPSDPTLTFTELKLGAKTYKLCFDFDAIARAEEITGMPLMAGVDFGNVGVKRVRAMLYASSLKAQPNVTLNDFTRHITPANIGRIEKALLEAWVACVAKEDEGENPTQPAATSQS